MTTSPPIAKVTRPVPADCFLRGRLFRQVDKARKAPILWICGPPGCGKTTLISSYVGSRRLPCVWYQVDEGDVDPATFFYYLGLASRKAASAKRRPLPLLTPDRLPGILVFARRYFEELAARLASPSLLVFDSCERVLDDTSFMETLREGISRLTPGINAVLVSRNDPHPSFVRQRANRLMEVLGWKDLRLTIKEAVGIARLRRTGRQKSALARDLHNRTDGWAAGLVLLLERADVGGVEPRDPRRQLPAEIFEYFGAEIFERQEEEIRSFMFRSAFLPKMTAAMAERLTGEARAGRILSNLNRYHYFTEKHSQPEPVYEYHALLREFLLGQACEALSRDEFARLRKEAALVLEECGYVEDAAGLFREGQDWEELARLALSQARVLVMQGRYRTLLEWITALSKEVIKDEPWLPYWAGVCRMPFSPGESRADFEEAFREFDMRGDASGAFLAWSGVVESIFIGQEDFKEFDPWVVIFPNLFDKYGGFPSEEIEAQVTSSMFKALLQRRLPNIDIEGWAERAMMVARKTPDARLKIDCSATFLYYKLLQGNVQDAEATLVSLRETLNKPGATPWLQFWVYWTEAVVSFFVSNYERCLQIVSDGLVFAEETGVRVGAPLLVGYGSLAALHVGDFDAANRFLRRLEATLGSMGRLSSSIYHLAVACQALHRGELGKAAFHSEKYLKETDEMGNVNPLPLAHLLAAHVHHALHNKDKATRHLDQARRIGTDIRLPWASWMCGLTEAYFHLKRNDEVSALEPLEEGLRVGRSHGLVGTTLWLPGFLEVVATKAIEKEIEVEYVGELIHRNRLVPDPANSDLEHWPWPIKVYTLGRFGLLREGKPVAFPRKVQQKPLQMLKILIALGGREIDEVAISDILWPEADGVQAHEVYSITVRRLRRLLGDDRAVVVREGRVTLSNLYCWVDAWAFERMLGRADEEKKEVSRGHRTDVAAHFRRKAISLYKGPFLAGQISEPCVVPFRQRLRSKFLRAVVEQGHHWESFKMWEEAVSCYLRGLEVDDLAERVYQRLMECHVLMGNGAEAVATYHRCRERLSAALGVTPSPRTEAIYRFIKSSCARAT